VRLRNKGVGTNNKLIRLKRLISKLALDFEKYLNRIRLFGNYC